MTDQLAPNAFDTKEAVAAELNKIMAEVESIHADIQGGDIRPTLEDLARLANVVATLRVITERLAAYTPPSNEGRMER